MSLPFPPLDHSAAGGASEVVFSEDPQVLTAIARREVGLAVWQRDVPEELAIWLDALPMGGLPNDRLLLRPYQAQRAVAGLLRGAHRGDQAMQERLAADVAQLVRVFADIAGQRLVDLRLREVEHDACWRFHYDHVPLRLICNYRGPATQWVPPEAREVALAAQRDYAGPLRELPRFAAALFKGALAPGQVGVVHRSPPIAGMGQTRLFLCLNEPSSVSPLPWEGQKVLG
ncbi:MAG: DUF1826 domain-containing protein [Kiloniellaceae bacterium]